MTRPFGSWASRPYRPGIVFLGIMRNIAKELAKIIDLPGHAFVSFGMALGRPDPNRAKSRPFPAITGKPAIHSGLAISI